MTCVYPLLAALLSSEPRPEPHVSDMSQTQKQSLGGVRPVRTPAGDHVAIRSTYNSGHVPGISPSSVAYAQARRPSLEVLMSCVALLRLLARRSEVTAYDLGLKVILAHNTNETGERLLI